MTNTTDKYITIPASELSGRELRAHPNGKRKLNPNYIEPESDREAREYRNRLLGIPGSNLWAKDEKKRIYFNDTEIGGKYTFFNGYYDCNSGEFVVTGMMDEDVKAAKLQDFRNKYGV